MKHYYNTRLFAIFVLLFATLSMSFVLEKSTSGKNNFDSIPSRFRTKNDQISYLKNGLKVFLLPIKPAQNQVNANSYTANSVRQQNAIKIENEKLLTDVSIFPNPITDKINVSYIVKKNTNVSIKIMDVLGNEVLTLMAQRVEAGEQKNTFQLNNRLSSGFYFVRMIVGTESVIKRISIL